jgi:hypothetical protein
MVSARVITSLLVGSAMLASCAAKSHAPGNDLSELLQQPKFVSTACYTGVDTPEDHRPLTAAVNAAVEDVTKQPDPRDPVQVRQRLVQLVQGVDLFATEDRDEVYRYAIKIWRASGMLGESGLFPKMDAEVLAQMPGC